MLNDEFDAALNRGPYLDGDATGRAGEALTELAPLTTPEQVEVATRQAKQFLQASNFYRRLAGDQPDESARGHFAALATGFGNRARLLIAGFALTLDDDGSEADPGDLAAAFGNGDPQYGPASMFGPNE